MRKNKSLLHIITPVYNEGKNFPKLYKQIKKDIKTPHVLVVVYDFEQDDTVPVVQKYQKTDKSIKLHKNTRGKGALNALLSGFDYVKSGPVLVIMADLSDDLAKVDGMYALYQDGADLVCGSRYMKGGQQIGGPWLKKFLSRTAGVTLYSLRGFPTHDVTNNFKLYDKKMLDKIEIESTGGFEVAMEITVKAFIRGARINELPTTWHDRTAGDTKFQLWKWLPEYIRWYSYAYRHKVRDDIT